MKAYKEAATAYDTTIKSHKEVAKKQYDNVLLSSRNLPKATVADAKLLNVYQILNANCLVLSESAVSRLSDMLS
ncbi:MAG: 50S ribosomal protein L4 [Aureispira sp.]